MNSRRGKAGRAVPGAGASRGVDCAVVAIVAVLVYIATVPYPFVYDDLELIPHQPAMQHPADLGAIFGGRYWGELREHDTLYRPVTVWTLAVNHAMNVAGGKDGADPAGYRVVNVLLHAAASSVALLFLRRAGLGRWAALLAALVFAVHPVHSEVVDSVVNRSEALAALGGFAFLTLHLGLRDAGGAARGERGARGARGRRDRVVASVVAACATLFIALGSKESAVAFLAVAAWLDLTVGRVASPGAHGAEMRTGHEKATPASATPWWRRRAAAYGAWAAVLLLWFTMRSAALHGLSQRTMPVDNPLVAAPLGARLVTAGAIQARYLALQFWPARLSSDYSMNQVPVVTNPANAWFLFFLASLGLAAAASWRLRRRRPLVAFAFGAYAITALPAGNLLFPIGTMMAERLVYTPSLFLFMAVAAAGESFAGASHRAPRSGGANDQAPNRALAVAVVAAVAILAIRTIERNRSWRDPDTFYRTQARTAPGSAKAHYSWGKRLLLDGRTAEAIAENRRAVEILPDYADAWNNLAAAMEKQGDVAGALDAYRRAASIPPGHAQAWFNIARILQERSDLDGAVESSRRALALDPSYLDAWNNLGIALAELGRTAEAADAWRRALAINPGYTPARDNLDMLSAAPGTGFAR